MPRLTRKEKASGVGRRQSGVGVRAHGGGSAREWPVVMQLDASEGAATSQRVCTASVAMNRNSDVMSTRPPNRLDKIHPKTPSALVDVAL